MFACEASTLVSEGYVSALVKDRRELRSYWESILHDFPQHPVKDQDPDLQSSLGCTLYGSLVLKVIGLCHLVGSHILIVVWFRTAFAPLLAKLFDYVCFSYMFVYIYV